MIKLARRRRRASQQIRHFAEQSSEPEINDVIRFNPHLVSYITQLDNGAPMPEYFEEITRELGDLDDPNLLYNVGDAVFIHIYPGPKRTMYHPVEPELTPEVISGMDYVMKRLTILIGPKMGPKDADEHAKMSDELLKRVLPDSSGFLSKLFPGKNSSGITDAVKERIRYYFIRDKIGLGVLEPLILDPNIEDISCNGLSPLFIEHKIFKSLESTINFASMEDVDRFVLSLTERSGRPATHMNPIVDAVLPDGSRLNAVYGRDLSKKGSNFTIRKVSETPLSISQLVNWKALTADIAGYIWMCLDNSMAIFIAGETASGKTTLLNACLAFISPMSKIVSIEDTPEVIVPHKNWIREVTRPASAGSSVDTFDLLKAALRQRPNYIIIGEIRGVEGNTAFQAMMTGHPVVSTFHAGTVKALINRLTGQPINVPPHFIKFLDLVIIQNAVHTADGKLLRRLISANELVGYSAKTGNYSFVNIATWNASTDTHNFLKASHILENKIAPRRGIRRKDVKILYREHRIRSLIIQGMIANKIFHYDQVWEVIQIYKLKGKLPESIENFVNERIRD